MSRSCPDIPAWRSGRGRRRKATKTRQGSGSGLTLTGPERRASMSVMEEGGGCRGSEVVVAKPSENDRKYVHLIRSMNWPELRDLWEKVASGNTPGWGDGKALEHLVSAPSSSEGWRWSIPIMYLQGGTLSS